MTDYKKQGEDFLTATNTTLEVIETVPQIEPLWDDSGKHISYLITLKNDRANYTFNYWGSINDFERVERAKEVDQNHDRTSAKYFSVIDFLKIKRPSLYAPSLKLEALTREAIKPTAYDVLASMNIIYSDTFEDFCAEFGYNTDSILAERTYKEVLQQDRMLRKLFTTSELEALSGIQ